MLVWNVYMEDFNGRCIKEYNIFNHSSFHNDLVKALKPYQKIYNNVTTSLKDINGKEYEKLKESIRCCLMYNFWCKCEYEIILSDFPPHDNFEDKKVDIYSQVMLNFDVFVDYIWRNKKSFKKLIKY